MKWHINTFFIFLVIFILFTLFLLGLKERVGYINDIEIDLYETLNINSIDINTINKQVYNNKAKLKEYIISNKSITNYQYHFKIDYYSKIFRSSDIFNVFPTKLEIVKANNSFIKKIEMNSYGTRFGYFISDKFISKINHVALYYYLKLKLSFILYSFLLTIIIYIAIAYFKVLFKKDKLLFIKVYFRFKKYYILSIFLAMLIFPNIVYYLFYDKFDHTNYENRNKVSKPIFNIRELDKYIKAYNLYFSDNLSFKNELVKLKNLIYIKVFNNVITFPSRILGKEKWLYYRTHELKYKNSLDEAKLLELKYKLINLRDKLKKENIEFIILICPQKEFIYSEYLPKYLSIEGEDFLIEKFIDYMKDTEVKIIYIKDELLKYKNKYQLYYKYDFHWNKLGAYIAYSKLMETLSLDYKPIETLSIVSNKYDNYDKSLLYGGHYNDLTPGLALSKSKFFKDDYIFDISNYYNNSFGYYITNFKEGAFDTYSYSNYYNKKLFVIRDSYFTSMINYIAPIFSNIFGIHLNNLLSKKVIKSRKPDIFIVEFLALGSNNLISTIEAISNIKLEDIFLDDTNN